MKLTKYTMLMLTRHGNEGPTRTTIGSFVEVITKGTSLQLFSEFDVEQANLRLNSYPRKILGGKSSLDRFEEEILKIIDPETLAV